MARREAVGSLEDLRTTEQPDSVLLDAAELAARLDVPPSWVKERTRRRANSRDLASS
jgi:hypothetical protein